MPCRAAAGRVASARRPATSQTVRVDRLCVARRRPSGANARRTMAASCAPHGWAARPLAAFQECRYCTPRTRPVLPTNPPATTSRPSGVNETAETNPNDSGPGSTRVAAAVSTSHSLTPPRSPVASRVRSGDRATARSHSAGLRSRVYRTRPAERSHKRIFRSLLAANRPQPSAENKTVVTVFLGP